MKWKWTKWDTVSVIIQIVVSSIVSAYVALNLLTLLLP